MAVQLIVRVRGLFYMLSARLRLQVYVMRLLFVPSPFPAGVCAVCVCMFRWACVHGGVKASVGTMRVGATYAWKSQVH